MVAERAADIPGPGTFPHKPDKVKVVLVAHLIGSHRKTPLGHRKTDVERALRVVGTADELRVAPQVFYRERAFADRAPAQVHLFCGPVPDIVADHGLVGLELVKRLVQHLAGFPDHVLPRPCALLDLLHMGFDRLGHVGPGDHVGMLFQRFGDHSADKGRAKGRAFHVFAGDEICDHFMRVLLVPDPAPPSAGSVCSGNSVQEAGSLSLRA